MIPALVAPVLGVTCRGPWLVATFGQPLRACSWAIVGGGMISTRHVAWLEVRDEDLRPPVDARDFLRERLQREGLGGAVGLMTSRRVSSYTQAEVDGVRCVATVGLGNALRAGDPPGPAARIGTINLLVHLEQPLADEALLEASAIATEAKTAAILGAAVTSRRTGRPATGTGTDCTVIASPPGRVRYAGKHTDVGAAIGAAVEQAVSAGVRRWMEERR